MIGNAHLDLAWLWPWQEGFGEAKATFLSALNRLEEFDGFIFTSSSAQYFAWVEDNAPELFARIRREVTAGRWVVCGGWWVQPDCNLPGGESFIRQGLLGQRYFFDRFGITASVGYNVDSFGHSAGLPQILRKSGLDSYIFLRPGEQEMELPQGPFHWKSPDGFDILACRIPVNYSSLTGLEEQIQSALDRFPEKTDHFICFYGVGNHGGGPTIANIRYILDHQQVRSDCRMVLSDPETYFDAVSAENQSFSVVKHDLHHHAPGCYSVQADIKKLNRCAEHNLVAAENFAVLAQMLPIEGKFCNPADDIWQMLLRCQFHDILAGAGTIEVCKAAVMELGGVITRAEQAANRCLQAVSFAVDIPYMEDCQPLVVFNPHSFPVTAVICHEKGSWGNPGFPSPCQVLDSGGNSVPSQFIGLTAQLDERERIAFLAQLPPLGYETFRIVKAEKSHPPAAIAEDFVLENDLVRVEVSPDTGLLISYRDKRSDIELLAAPSGRILAHEDFSDAWGHGVTRFNGPSREAEFVSMTWLEHGAVRQKIAVQFRLGNSILRQTYSLQTGSPALEAELKVNWQEKHICLKVYMDLMLENPASTWEVPFGACERPADGIENPMQTWLDVSGYQNGVRYGMAFSSDGICGGHTDGRTVGLTILRSPVYAHHAPHLLDKSADFYEYAGQGTHSVRYLMLPHAGFWQESTAPKEALVLNRPPVKIVETFHPGSLPQRIQGISISGEGVLLSCLKFAWDGDGLILRLYESLGKAEIVTVSLPLLEQNIPLEFGPFEVKTLRLRPGQEAQECLMTEFPLTNQEKDGRDYEKAIHHRG